MSLVFRCLPVAPGGASVNQQAKTGSLVQRCVGQVATLVGVGGQLRVTATLLR